MTKKSRALAFVALWWALFYAWRELGMDGAGNLIAFWCFVLGLVGVLCLLANWEPGSLADPIDGAVRYIDTVSTLAAVGSLAWIGSYALAAMVLLGFVGDTYAHSRGAARAAQGDIRGHENH